MSNAYVAVSSSSSFRDVPRSDEVRVALYFPPVVEFDPNLYLDKDPITSEEEEDLYRSYKDFEEGNVTHLSSKCKGEEFLRKLKG